MISKNTNSIKITVGVTLNYFFLSLIIIGFAIFVTVSVNFFLAIPLYYFGFLALISIQGFIIDINKKKLMKYYNFYPLKIGRWESIEGYDRMVLVLSHDATVVDIDGRYGNKTQTERTRSFDIYLRNRNEEKIPLIEFPEYKFAREFLVKYGQQMNIEMIDLFEESILISRERRH